MALGKHVKKTLNLYGTLARKPAWYVNNENQFSELLSAIKSCRGKRGVFRHELLH